MELTNKAVLITGGRRMGLVLGAQLAARGADVALAYARSRREADDAARAVRAAGRRAEVVRADVRDPASCRTLVETAADRLGRLDVLVNMASVYCRHPIDQLDVEAWDATLEVDLRGACLCALAAVPHMRRQGGGRIVNFSDWTARSGRPRYPGFLPYYVAKAGVIGLTEALALELAPHNILVNAIAPGPMLPPAGTSDDERRAVEAATPLGRWGGALEVAKAVLALIDADFTTGETVRVDGGRHVK